MTRIAVLGAGAWGSALASSLAPRQPTMLWARDAVQAAQLDQSRRNERYLPGLALAPQLAIVARIEEALAHAAGGLLLLAVPIASLRPVLQQIGQHDFRGSCAWLCKGLERDTGMLAHQIAGLELPSVPGGPLSGPSFAVEVARGLPTALVVAGTPELCATVTGAVHGGNLRVYSTDDVVGVEIGGAVKNVMAIAAGIADAMQLGHNARAALVTRGLSETRRFGEALGARAETFTGLTGLGDLLLTCTGDLSRNRRIGLALGRGVALEQAIAELGHVAEGVWSAPAIVARAHAVGVEMPITEAVCAVLEGTISARAAVGQLLSRDPRVEHH
jgi:glycerol-3-phosphate dehydrogenase (NAD(P)+)